MEKNIRKTADLIEKTILARIKKILNKIMHKVGLKFVQAAGPCWKGMGSSIRPIAPEKEMKYFQNDAGLF